MKRSDLEHVVAAAADISGEYEFIVIGSQAILGSMPNAPENLLFSMEVDIYPRANPEKAESIDGAIGDGSLFHGSFGFYAHGVGPETAKPPAGWEERLVRIEIPPRVGSGRAAVAYCLEPHDLVLAKCVAGRERDWEFARDAMTAGIVARETLLSRIESLPVSQQERSRIKAMIEGIIERSR